MCFALENVTYTILLKSDEAVYYGTQNISKLIPTPTFKILGAEFHVSLLSIAQLFDFAKDLQKEIYDE